MLNVANRLARLGIELPGSGAPIANYAPFTRSGSLVHVSGQLSRGVHEEVRGTVGVDVPIERAIHGARLCAVNLLAQFRAACGGDLDRVSRVLRLGGFVQAGPDFFDISAVINGASDLMIDVFGPAGRHARAAIGAYRLPFGYAVEVDAVVEIAS